MINQRIKNARLLRGYTQEYLAEKMEMSVMQISRYETGKSEPSAEALVKIALALNVSTDYQLGISDEIVPYRGVGLNTVEKAIISALRHGNKMEAMKVLVNEG